ncbi:hypothetical protein J14TS2_50040 [Bacillus sp. J14TS2]|uniref:ABC transporter permease n=1 Tax=Bacillus sp. J14TS2 TaxID=2807188 RepID=UPI001B0A929E|nr:ABC transporter permease [Bacillus sp. J14TS2]GIN74529.1 hypothetical protein J14TS2_50040 [Bacillus sp. J14TS2]
MVSKLWQLSHKMLLVKKGRTLFSILAIALGVGLLCSMFQMHLTFNNSLQQRLEDEYGSADIRISSPPPFEVQEWSGLDNKILENIPSIDQIQSVGLALEGKMASGILYENQNDVIIDDTDFHYVGVDNEKITKEYYKFEQDLSNYEVALSKSLADRWNVAISDSIKINLMSGRSVTWRVAEIIQPTVNKGEPVEDWVIFHLPSLQEILGLSETINPILVGLEPGANIRQTSDSLISQLPENVRIDALNGLEEEGNQYTFFRIYGYILSIIAFIISITLVYSIMQTTYRERLQELAVIRAVGGSPEQLMKMVIYEWALIGAIGSFLGLVLAQLYSRFGIHWVAASLFSMELFVENSPRGIIGMLVTALFSWFVIVLTSLGIVWKVGATDPVQSFRESAGSADAHNSKGIWWIIFVVTGLLFWLINFTISKSTTNMSLMNMKVMFSMLGGLLLIIALLSRTIWLGVSILKFITLLPEWMTSRSLRLSVHRLLVERSQLIPIILMALIMTVYIPVATLFHFMDQSDSISDAEQMKADFFINAHQEISFDPKMPWYLKHEMEEIEWVEKVLPLPITHFAKIIDNDINLTSEDQSLIAYGVTDLTALAEWDLASFPDNVLEDAGILPQYIADELGIKIGDSLQIVVDGQSASVTIVDITEKLETIPSHSKLLIDESHSIIQPAGLDEIFVKIKDGYDEQMKQRLNLLQRVYLEMRWIQTGEAASTFENTRQQALSMLQGITILILVSGIGGMLNAFNAGIHARKREYAVLRSIYSYT